MKAGIALVTAMVVVAALSAAPAAWADGWFNDLQQAPVRVSPDLADRAAAAQQLRLANMLDSREHALGTNVTPRIVRSIRTPVVDDRFRIDHSAVPVPVSASQAGTDIDWPQIGIGFGFGIALMLGLYMTLKATRPRSLAH